MSEETTKSSLSGCRTYQELREYWDTHSLADHWEQTSPVEFEVDVNVTDETRKTG
jgi:hypothetical protein